MNYQISPRIYLSHDIQPSLSKGCFLQLALKWFVFKKWQACHIKIIPKLEDWDLKGKEKRERKRELKQRGKEYFGINTSMKTIQILTPSKLNYCKHFVSQNFPLYLQYTVSSTTSKDVNAKNHYQKKNKKKFPWLLKSCEIKHHFLQRTFT